MKRAEEGMDDLGEKSINDFPDVVLQHILSFLSTDDAVRTSVLSKKWEHLWKSITNLDFNQFSYAKKAEIFMNYVERALVLRDASNIEKFSLYCRVDDVPRIRTWVAAAVNRNVKGLCFKFYQGNELESFVFPRCLFTCATLTKLEINFCGVLRLPSSISLPCLKILSLAYIIFPDEDSTQRLLNLPTLEELSINACDWDILKAITISGPKLRRLDIRETAESLDACHVMIFGTALTFFSLRGGFSNDYCLFKSSSLVEAYFHFYDSGEISRENAYRIYKHLLGLSTVKRLTLSTTVFEILDHAAELFAHPLAVINLTTLRIDSSYVDLHCNAFWHILYNSPHLKTLSFCEVKLSKLPSNIVEEDWILESVPPCFQSSLKYIEIRNFYGDGNFNELNAVTLLLNNAVALDKMVITCSLYYSFSLEKLGKIRAQLLELPRWSEIGKINFVG